MPKEREGNPIVLVRKQLKMNKCCLHLLILVVFVQFNLYQTTIVTWLQNCMTIVIQDHCRKTVKLMPIDILLKHGILTRFKVCVFFFGLNRRSFSIN
jgi:hypothetical protein